MLVAISVHLEDHETRGGLAPDPDAADPSWQAPGLLLTSPSLPHRETFPGPQLPYLYQNPSEPLLQKGQNWAKAQWSKGSANEVRVSRSIPLWAN